jgi:integrating conjugative element protein (TIGR03756 family)
MMIKLKFLTLICALPFVASNAYAGINSAKISEATVKAIPQCLHFHIIGACVWFSPFTGYSTTPLVEYYSPDLVASVFNRPGDNPWSEINETLDQAGKKTEQQIVSSLAHDDAGSGQHSYGSIQEQNTFFKEADVIGNPGLAMLSQPGLLASTAVPLNPYYQSMLDAGMWRGFPNFPSILAEEAKAMMADITHHVGAGPIYWGGIYPHEGKVATTNDAKAASVIAQRAADLTTSTAIPGHIYQPLPNQCGEHCDATPIQENSDKTQFQMIYPNQEDTCDYFGKTLSYGESAEIRAQGAYIWIIWRYYRGCHDGAGDFVQEIKY